jgi:hypothetical protein
MNGLDDLSLFEFESSFSFSLSVPLILYGCLPLSECIEFILDPERFFGYLPYSGVFEVSFANADSLFDEENGLSREEDDVDEFLKDPGLPLAPLGFNGCCLISGDEEEVLNLPV